MPLAFDEKVVTKVFDFIKHEMEGDKLPEIPRPCPSPRLQDFLPMWFANYIDLQSLEDIYDLIAAANYLDVPSLVELGCAKVGSMMQNKDITELRVMFNISNDFAPDEERAIFEGRADIWGTTQPEDNQ